MSLSAIIIGYGSIGKRHAEILQSINEVSDIYVLTSQIGLPYKSISKLEDIIEVNPDYLVIASPTSHHYKQLKFIENNFNGKKILVEKPLFDSLKNLEIVHNDVYVGYNLRFHPIVKKIKNLIKGRQLWNINVFCGSYLPDWRPERDYRKTSSARKHLGGGVLLDLSHEFDYVQWLVGKINLEYAINKKVSNLEISSDDLLLLTGKTEMGTYVNISLNYFTRKPIRRIVLDGDGISLQGDLIANDLSVFLDDKTSDFSWSNLKRNDTYQSQHKSILQANSIKACTFSEGLEVIHLIENICKA